MMDMKLELVPIPVTDIERAKAFYVEKMGFHLDHDVQPSPNMRVIQLTPPGSACSILIGAGMGEITEMKPGSIKGLHLVVKDLRALRDALVRRGVAMGDVTEYPDGMKFSGFGDPDGNMWVLQEMP